MVNFSVYLHRCVFVMVFCLLSDVLLKTFTLSHEFLTNQTRPENNSTSTFTTLWIDSEDDKLSIFSLFFIYLFYFILFTENCLSLHEISKSIFRKKKKKKKKKKKNRNTFHNVVC